MKRLIMCKGLPGSGKTTWALEQVDKGVRSSGREQYYHTTHRVNKDDIRRELEATGWTWSRENEKDVTDARDSRIRMAFSAGAETVISDDTNFSRKHRQRLEQLAKEHGAAFGIREFHTPIDVCIERDALRTGKAHVGAGVIRSMAEQYGLAPKAQPTFLPVTRDEHLMPAIICDLDGTLCLLNGRNPYDASTCDHDLLNPVVRQLLEVHYRFMQWQILYVSGRKAEFKPQTYAFMRKHHVPPGPLFMREVEDNRADWIVKGEIFDREIRGKYDVRFVLDDRDQVVRMWRSIGLTCLQVAEGSF